MRAAFAGLALCLAGSAAAQDRTMATYGDWAVRCENAPSRNCEAATALSLADNRPVAQLIIGRRNNQGPLLILVVVPLNVYLPGQIRLVLGGAALNLAYQRCTPQGCFATLDLDEATMTRLRGEPSGGRLLFQDGEQREISANLSLRGFAQAQAALAARR